MAFFEFVPSLTDRIRADDRALTVLRAIADMTIKLETVDNMHKINRRLRRWSGDTENAVHALLNAGLLDGDTEGKGAANTRFTLTAAGWDMLGMAPPIWMIADANSPTSRRIEQQSR